MSNVNVVCADVLDWCESYNGSKFHALLCDAPYQYGFMGRSWDSTGITYQPETWAALAEHLHPGAFLMVFGGARSWHRLAVAMEDAGLVIHPTIFIWAQGQGFPKATRIDTAIDKAAGKFEEREIIGYKKLNSRDKRTYIPTEGGGYHGVQSSPSNGMKIELPATDLARAWQGHRYGLQALKPAVEPIIVAQKPYSGKPVECIVDTGAGALWIDGGRVATGENLIRPAIQRSPDEAIFPLGAGIQKQPQGRWPPNFALCHVPSHWICQSCQAVHPIQPVVEVCDCGGDLMRVEGCKRVGVKRVRGTNPIGPNPGSLQEGYHGGGRSVVGQNYADPDGRETVADFRCAEGCVVARLGAMSTGYGRSSCHVNRSDSKGGELGFVAGKGFAEPDVNTYSDKGTAARFYPQADWEHEEMECLPDCPVAKLDEQSGERGGKWGRQGDSAGTSMFMGEHKHGGKDSERFIGDPGGASRFYPNANWTHEVAEQLAQAGPVHYCPKAAKRERNNGLDDFYWRRDKASPTGFVRVSQEEWETLPKRQRARGNIHSTVKPLGLLKWIAVLLLPPPEYAPRRILVPFSGSGSEAIAAALVGFEEVVAVEMLHDYCDIAEARAAFWLTRQLELPAARPRRCGG